jgi:hypothetical protein
MNDSSKKAIGGEEILRWLTGDDEALKGTLRRESVSGANDVRMAGDERPGYI